MLGLLFFAQAHIGSWREYAPITTQSSIRLRHEYTAQRDG